MYQYIAPSINLFISGTIFYYLNYLNQIGCKCSLTFQKKYIYYYTIVIFLVSLVSILFQNKIKGLSNVLLPIAIILLIAGIINIIYTIEYVEDMKKQNCKCSESIIRDLMFIIACLQIFVWIILICLVIFIFITKKIPFNGYVKET
jgi:hypothetical protein